MMGLSDDQKLWTLRSYSPFSLKMLWHHEKNFDLDNGNSAKVDEYLVSQF